MTAKELYVSMGKAIQQRDRALSMVEQWQRKADEAEQQILAIASQMQAGEPVEQV